MTNMQDRRMEEVEKAQKNYLALESRSRVDGFLGDGAHVENLIDNRGNKNEGDRIDAVMYRENKFRINVFYGNLRTNLWHHSWELLRTLRDNGDGSWAVI